MNVKELAEQAGMHSPDGFKLTVGHMAMFQLERFAELVAAHEREECVKMFESIHKDSTVPPVYFSLSDTVYLIKTRSKE
jgi:hypothetical protein